MTLTGVNARMKIQVVQESEGFGTKFTFVWLDIVVFSSNVTVEIILGGECALTKLAHKVLWYIWVVGVLMLSQFVLVKESLFAVGAVERFVFLVAEEVRDNFFPVWIKLWAHTTAISYVLYVILPVPNHIAQLISDVGTHNTSACFVRRMRFYVLDHFVVRAKHRLTNHAEILMIFGPLEGGFLQQFADQHVPFEGCFRVELFVARFAQKIISRPILLQPHLEL
jgi:hypothetical protein